MKEFDVKLLPIPNQKDLESKQIFIDKTRVGYENTVALIKIESIFVSNRLRKVSESKVDELAESIAAVGLLQPIVISEDKNLVAGLHRLNACQQLGFIEIYAVVISNQQLHKEIAEIDENLIRKTLTVLEQCEQLKRRKELYEALYPETRRGGFVRQTRDNYLETGTINDNRVVYKSFSNRAAQERKVTQRTIQRAVRIAERLDTDVKNKISNLPVPLRFTQLMHLAEFEPTMQRKITEVMSDEKLSFQQAIKTLNQSEMVEGVNGESASAIKLKDNVKRWVRSFTTLLRQFESFDLTELQTVIEQIKHNRIDYSALRRLLAECRETLATANIDNPTNILTNSSDDSTNKNKWCKNTPKNAPLPLFQNEELTGEQEL